MNFQSSSCNVNQESFITERLLDTCLGILSIIGIVSLDERKSLPFRGIRRNTGNGPGDDGTAIGPHGATELPAPIANDE